MNPGYPWYHERYGREIVQSFRYGKKRHQNMIGNDVTFPEFIRYIIDLHNKRRTFDEHWRPMYKLASPCRIHYDYIGKFETLHHDIETVLKLAYRLKSVDESTFNGVTPTTNHSIIAHFYNQIPASDIEALKEVYSLDFQMFNYSTEIPRLCGKSKI